MFNVTHTFISVSYDLGLNLIYLDDWCCESMGKGFLGPQVVAWAIVSHAFGQTESHVDIVQNLIVCR